MPYEVVVGAQYPLIFIGYPSVINNIIFQYGYHPGGDVYLPLAYTTNYSIALGQVTRNCVFSVETKTNTMFKVAANNGTTQVSITGCYWITLGY